MINIGTVQTIGKYDLSTNSWRRPKNKYELGGSFSIVNYELIRNNEKADFHYIIICPGSRVEDHSKNFIKVDAKESGINNVINYFKDKNENYIIKLFLMDADAPIEADAEMMAKYIDSIANDPFAKSVNLVGISKCGAMSFNVPKYFRNPMSMLLTNIFTVAAPFIGTRMASPKLLYSDVKRIVTSQFGDNKLTDLLYDKLIELYESISSNSHMDYDIAIPDGITDDKLSVYDRSFIANMFSLKSLTSITMVRTYQNITTGIDNKTLMEAIRTCNVNGIGLCIMDDLIFNKTSDGMVPKDAQRSIEKYFDPDTFRTYNLLSSHHDVMGNKRVVNDLCGIVSDVIEEPLEERQKIKIYR